MKIVVACIVIILGLAGEAKAQASDKNTTVESVMVNGSDSKLNFLIGLSESLSTRWPMLQMYELTNCLAEVAEFPGNWKKDIGPFAHDCAVKLYGPPPH